MPMFEVTFMGFAVANVHLLHSYRNLIQIVIRWNCLLFPLVLTLLKISKSVFEKEPQHEVQ